MFSASHQLSLSSLVGSIRCLSLARAAHWNSRLDLVAYELKHSSHRLDISWLGRELLAFITLAFLLAASPLAAAEPAPRGWWKGNLHTHSLWSDGDDYPEMVAAWYKDHGYHFLALSDHNILLEGERWLNITEKRGGGAALQKYLARFGEAWVERRQVNGTNQVRLKTLTEFRSRFEERGKFLMIPSLEITDQHLTAPVHVNASNIKELIAPQGGKDVLDVMRRNVNAVLQQRERTGQPMFPHLNHPNFGWGITAEELMRVEGERFFEVYNGHPAVRNEGDATHASTERMWDIILTWRRAVLNLPLMYGLAVDDSHHYHSMHSTNSNSGRGWVMVRARSLVPDAIIHALEAGDFYASSGVTLSKLSASRRSLRVEIQTESGIRYRTQFIGTRRGFDRANEPIRTVSGEALRQTHRYSPDVGKVLAEVEGSSARYDFQGDELYVRAKVISTKLKSNPYLPGETEAAWIQPVAPRD